MLAPQSQSATRLYLFPVTSRKVMEPFWRTASIEEKTGLPPSVRKVLENNFGIGNGKTSFPFLLNDKHLTAASGELQWPNV